ncbi:hypothetical protein QFZ48_001135 [Chitinophaga sp. W2I13]
MLILTQQIVLVTNRYGQLFFTFGVTKESMLL